MQNNKILYRGNSIYKLSNIQPYMHKINSYIIYYSKFSLFHYNRRTAGDKYSYAMSNHLLLVDLSDIDMSLRHDFINENWGGFVYQLMDQYSYSDNSILPIDTSIDINSNASESDGTYKLNKLYTTMKSTEYTFPSLFHVYGAMLLTLDIAPSQLWLELWSGYDGKGNGEPTYYNINNFRNDFIDLNR